MGAITEREDLYLAYAAGLLAPAHSLVVASQAALRKDVRRELGDYEAIAGVLLEEEAPVSLSAGLRERVMAELDEGEPKVAAPAAAGDRRLPAPLRAWVGGSLEALRWRRLGRGASDCTLSAAAGSTLRIMWVKGGTAMPSHSHGGLELTLVLEGAYSDCTGRYGPGDLQMADGGVDHSPTVAVGEDCLCVVASEAPIRFTGRFGRLLNPFVRY